MTNDNEGRSETATGTRKKEQLIVWVCEFIVWVCEFEVWLLWVYEDDLVDKS
jgi:hypothetical protein